MATQRYGVTQPPVDTLLTWIDSGEIAIPEIQRPFVWTATKVRDLLDSLFRGYPVGYLIAWRNPNVKLKDGKSSDGKRILIDGQQRVTALMAALKGIEVVNKDYQKQKIRIAFHPKEERFEVTNPAIEKDKAWLPDVAAIFAPSFDFIDTVEDYCAANAINDKKVVSKSIQRLQGITTNQIGIIELNSDLDIETVTEIFIRVNSQGVALSQADFAMSKIAVNETYGGNLLRKAIDYFCHLAKSPEFFQLMKNDSPFLQSDLYQPLIWMKDLNDDLYDPSYTDMLRVACASEFCRGKLEDLVALLSGRNFETREYQQEIVEDTFKRLKEGIVRFMNQNHFKTFLMILRSGGFVDASLIGSQNAVNFAYILYLWMRKSGVPAAKIERSVRKWFVFSMLTERYTSSPESTIDFDVRQLETVGFDAFTQGQFGTFSNAFWDTALPQSLATSSTGSPYWRVFKAAQVKLNDRGFLSRDITAKDLVEIKSDEHHLFPQAFLKEHGKPRGQYNQIANLAITQSEINNLIGKRPPAVYFKEVVDQCGGGPQKYGNITTPAELAENRAENCIPDSFETMTIHDYDDFLARRRVLMAQKIKTYFESL